MSNPIECPYCLSPVDSSEQRVTCDSCGAVYHQECWFENDGCCVGNCSQVTRHLEVDILPEQGDLLVLTRESVESAIQHKPERKWNPCLRCGRHVPEGDLYCRNCTPEPEGSQDAKNLGPILIMLLLVALAVFWLIYFSNGPADTQETPPTAQQGDTKR